MHEESVYLGLGSNVGDRLAHLRAGLAGLQEGGLELRALSSFYLTEPELGSAAADDGHAGDDPHHPWYVNCVAAFVNAPAPRRLLSLCLDVERSEGRDRGRDARRSKGGPAPRTLDIDVLLIGDRIIDDADLKVPHPRMSRRRFVLQPLVEIAPDLRHPIEGASMRELLAALPQRRRVTLLQPQPEEVP